MELVGKISQREPTKARNLFLFYSRVPCFRSMHDTMRRYRSESVDLLFEEQLKLGIPGKVMRLLLGRFRFLCVQAPGVVFPYSSMSLFCVVTKPMFVVSGGVEGYKIKSLH